MSPRKRQKQTDQETFDFEDSGEAESRSDSKSDEAGNDKAPLARSYKNWFLEYVSYVILDRAVPALEDGLRNSMMAATTKWPTSWVTACAITLMAMPAFTRQW